VHLLETSLAHDANHSDEVAILKGTEHSGRIGGRHSISPFRCRFGLLIVYARPERCWTFCQSREAKFTEGDRVSSIQKSHGSHSGFLQ
jgi:hypothetical protein